ncbi:MAG: hypothetical protein QG670_1307 [Thermoproteota archaeon]|nr:hypothetical protein [Thermoproteota archaeon]
MDMTLVITAIGTIVTIIAANIALVSWMRSDIKSFETEIRGWKEEIYKEMRDFHGRLCSIEERNRIPKTDP